MAEKTTAKTKATKASKPAVKAVKKISPATEKAVKPAKSETKVAKSSRIGVIEINKMQYIGREGETINARIALDSKENLNSVEVKLLALVNPDTKEFNYGAPYLDNKIDFEVGERVLGEKVTSSTFKAKARYRRKVGIRQKFVQVKINSFGK